MERVEVYAGDVVLPRHFPARRGQLLQGVPGGRAASASRLPAAAVRDGARRHGRGNPAGHEAACSRLRGQRTEARGDEERRGPVRFRGCLGGAAAAGCHLRRPVRSRQRRHEPGAHPLHRGDRGRGGHHAVHGVHPHHLRIVLPQVGTQRRAPEVAGFPGALAARGHAGPQLPRVLCPVPGSGAERHGGRKRELRPGLRPSDRARPASPSRTS